MDIEGSLEMMNLSTLVQFVAQEQGYMLIQLEHQSRIGLLYLNNHQLCHAILQDSGQGSEQIGEEVVYELLNWQTGRFKVSKGVPPPVTSIEKNWDFLLMEGLRRIDEHQAQRAIESEEQSLSYLLSDLSESDARIVQEMIAQQMEKINMANVKQTLEEIMRMEGAVAAALVDWQSGLTLGTIGTGFNIDLAAAGNTNVVRAKLGVMKDLKLKGTIEDMLITLTEQYHLIRILESNPNLFLYVALNRANANLGMARHRLVAIEKELTV